MATKRSNAGRVSRSPNKEKDDNARKRSRSSSNTRMKPRQILQQNDEDHEDTMSVDTASASNKDTLLSIYATFITIRFDVKASAKGSETMRNKLCELYKVLLQADATIQFTKYKCDNKRDKETSKVITKTTDVLSNPENIPTSITAMSNFFFGARPNSKGGAVWAQTRVVHSEEIDNIIEDTKEDFKEKGAQIYKQTIQHWDVTTVGFLKNVHPEVDIENLSEYFQTTINKSTPSNDIEIGLKVKVPYDGKKRDPKVNTNYRSRIQAIHVMTRGTTKQTTTNILKHILKSPKFKQRYRCDARLIPLYDRNSGPYIQDKIRKCITQHGQFCQCVNSRTCDGIEFLDQVNSGLKKTLRELILDLPDAHFINIDLNWSRSAYAILYPKKYEEKATERIANLGAYLHQTYGDKVLKSLPAEVQAQVKEVTWDEVTGRPLSKLDRELDNILQEGEDLEYVDMSLITREDERPSTATLSTTFIPHVDSESVSTFGTSSPYKVSTEGKLSQALTSYTTNTDEHTAISDMTLDSRVLKMENKFDNIEELLHVLVDRTKIDIQATPPNISKSAGAAKAASARGD